jgi:hypothetical protein
LVLIIGTFQGRFSQTIGKPLDLGAAFGYMSVARPPMQLPADARASSATWTNANRIPTNDAA